MIWAIGWGTFTPSFSLFFKPLLSEFGWTRADTTLAFSLSFLVQAGMSIIMGWLTDRLGPRIVIVGLGSTLGISYFLLSRVSTLWQFTLIYGLVTGIGVSVLNVPVMVTISRWFIKQRGLMIGIVQAGMGLGGFVFAPLIGWLIIRYNWRLAYIILSFITLAGMITGGLLLRRDPREKGQMPDGVDLAVESGTASSGSGLQASGFTLRDAFHMSQFWFIAGLFGAFGFCRSTYTAHLAAHVQDMGFSLGDGANVMALVIGASVFGRIGLGRVADLIGNRRGFIISFGVTGASLIWVLISNQLWMFYVFAFVFGVAWGNQAVLRFAIASETFGLASLGLIMGVLGVTESVAATLGSYIAGYVFDLFGNYFGMFYAGIGISMLGMIFALRLRPVSSTSYQSLSSNAHECRRT